jgi:uncharacterized protein (TIGR04255 family)
MTETPKPLAVPTAQPVSYARNFVKMAVCELRFPTLLELENQPPVGLQSALRKDYPFYEPGRTVSIQPGAVGQEVVYTLLSKNRRWQIALKPSALTIATNHYSGFVELYERVDKVLHSTLDLLDTDFFTRVGLRYQNVLPTAQEELDGWVNPHLVSALTSGVLGTLDHYWQDIRGKSEVGGYLLRHGLAPDPPQNYALDIDFYAETVEAKDVMSLVRQMHAQSFSLFDWAIGPKAREHLGPSRPK